MRVAVFVSLCAITVGCSARTDAVAGEDGECIEHLIMPSAEQLAEREHGTAEWLRVNWQFHLYRRPILSWDNPYYDRTGYLRPGDRAPVLARGVEDWVRVRSPSMGAAGWIRAVGYRVIRHLNTTTLTSCQPDRGTADPGGGG